MTLRVSYILKKSLCVPRTKRRSLDFSEEIKNKKTCKTAVSANYKYKKALSCESSCNTCRVFGTLAFNVCFDFTKLWTGGSLDE